MKLIKRITIGALVLVLLLLAVPALTWSSECTTVWIPCMIPIYNIVTGEVTWVTIGYYPVQDCTDQ